MGQKNRLNEIYKEIQKMPLPAEREASPIKLERSAINLTEKNVFVSSAQLFKMNDVNCEGWKRQFCSKIFGKETLQNLFSNG